MTEQDNSKKQPTSALELLAIGIELLDGKKGDQGEKGEKGDTGEKGADSTVPGPKGENGKDGADGKDGRDGIDGLNGKDGEQGPKGDVGPQGPKGEDGKDAEPVTQEILVDVMMPIIVQQTQRAVAAKTYSASEIEGALEATFETVSKNLDASGATLSYTGDVLTSIAYVNGVIKTLNYTGDNLTSVVLSGSTPAGIDLTKTLSYTVDKLTAVAYT